MSLPQCKTPTAVCHNGRPRLRKELGLDYVEYKGIIHGRGRGSMQCSYMLGRHTAGWAVNKNHQLLWRSILAMTGPTVLFTEGTTDITDD